MPNSQKFINKISKVINQDEKLNIPRTLKFMEAALELTQDNLNHKEFVCRVLKTGTFKPFLLRIAEPFRSPII
jgi:hypothetical protein